MAGLFYIASVQQLVCLGNDNSLVTLAEEDDTWQVALYELMQIITRTNAALRTCLKNWCCVP